MFTTSFKVKTKKALNSPNPSNKLKIICI